MVRLIHCQNSLVSILYLMVVLSVVLFIVCKLFRVDIVTELAACRTVSLVLVPLKSTFDFALLRPNSGEPATYPCLKDHSYTFFNLESLTSLTVMRYIFSQGLIVPWQELTLEVTSILSSSGGMRT